MLTSNPKFSGKVQFEPAPAAQPLGAGNTGRWFKRVGTSLVSSAVTILVCHHTSFAGGWCYTAHALHFY
jgi:hypothetical protein